MDIYESVKELISTQLEIDGDKISEETTFDELGADSLDLIDVVADIESKYEIEIAESEFEKIKTVGDIEKIIGERI